MLVLGFMGSLGSRRDFLVCFCLQVPAFKAFWVFIQIEVCDVRLIQRLFFDWLTAHTRRPAR